jgi:hypothetical protein
MYKDVIVEIALNLHPHDAINLSLTCKKYHGYLFKNIHYWKRKILYDFNYLCLKNTIKKCVECFIMLENISENPNNYYRKSIRENNKKMKHLIEKLFKVTFPYIGIISDDKNYFAVMDIFNLKNLQTIPEEPELKTLGYLSICHHARTMGIPLYRDYNDIIPLIRKKLQKRTYKVGDTFLKF